MQQINATSQNDKIYHPVIFFDGVCGLCNSFIDIIFKADKNHVFRFSTLQGETAKKYVSELPEESEEWSVVYVDENGTHYQSDATLYILHKLGGAWKLFYIFIYLPKSIRDLIYRIVAKNRYRIFGRRDRCRIPTEDERSRFLP